jgi:FkbM family methyltransferase
MKICLFVYLNHFLKIILTFKNFHLYFLDAPGLIKSETYILKLRNGLRIKLRSQKKTGVSDRDIIHEILIEDQYHIKQLIKPGDTVVDIGAHIGVFSLLASGSARKVYAFEPVPGNFQLFSQNVALNKIPNISLFNKAVLGENREVKVYLSDWNTGAHSIFGHHCSYVEIQGITLKDIFENQDIERINLLKLDCEGAEYDIILKTPKEYMRKIDRIILEQHITTETKKEFHEGILVDYLRKNGFCVHIEKQIYYENEGHFLIIYAKKIPVQN